MCLYERPIQEFLEKEDVWLEHPEKGVLDRGFYTGAERALFEGSRAQCERRHADAVELLSQVVEVDRDNDQAFVLRAVSRLSLGDTQNSLADLKTAIERNENNWKAYEVRAGTFMQMGEYRSAINALNSAIRLRPGKTELRIALAGALAHSGAYDDAFAELASAENSPVPLTTDLKAQILEMKALIYTDWGKDAAAETVLTELGKLIDPTRLRAHLNMMRRGRSNAPEFI